MKTHQLIQGTPEWHAHRATHYNASDAPAMMGCSPYKTRSQLLHEMHTGLTPDVDAATQRRFDDGHRFEALARPLAEKIIGEDLYPITGSEGKPSASFDGLTMAYDVAFEHKSLNDDLRACMRQQGGNANDFLPLVYRVQMEQQCMVSGCEKVLFMASKWQGDKLVEERHCWYMPDADLAAQITAGWAQFAADLAAYVPAATAPVLVAEPVQSLPAVLVQVSGEIAIKDNFKAFEVALRDFLEHRLIREPKTDQDFADLDAQIKAMKGAEEALAGAEAQMLAQVQSIDQAKKTKDMLAKLVRDNRLMAEKLLSSEKDRRRAEIVAEGGKAFADFMNGLNAGFGKPYMPQVQTNFPGVIKGMKSMASMENAVATELARAKIEASGIAQRITINFRVMEQLCDPLLFPDFGAVCTKDPEDFSALVAMRVGQQKAAEEKREAELRERIRAEEQAKAEREAREKLKREADAQAELDEQNRTPPPAQKQVPAPLVAVLEPVSAPALALATANDRIAAPGKLIRLGQINERLAPISITADGLAQLGYTPAAIDKTAKLYRESDLQGIYSAMTRHIQAAWRGVKQAA